MPTQVRKTLATMLEIYREDGMKRTSNVRVQVTRHPRGRTSVHIGEGDVVLTLSEAERKALAEALS